MFVDDEVLILRSLARVFRSSSISSPLFVQTPADALAICRSRHVDVVVSDFMLPEMNGTELLAAVRTLLPGSTRFLLTGYATASVVAEAVRAGTVHAVYAKPFDSKALVDAVEDALRSPASCAGDRR